MDSSLIELFHAELETHLPAISEGLLALEREPDQPKRLEALMRAAHSVKGAAKIVGVEAAVRVAHVMEDCFVAAQKGQLRLNSPDIDTLLRGVDMLQLVGRGQTAGSELGELVEAIKAIKEGTTRPSSPPAPPPPAPAQAIEPPSPPVQPVVRPSGDLDPLAAEEMRQSLHEWIQAGTSQINLDLSDVRQVSPEGLAILALAAQAIHRHSPPVLLVIEKSHPHVRELLRLSGLDGYFRFSGG